MRSPRSLPAVVVVAALVLTACGRSNVPEDAEVTVSGVFRMPDGAPAAGVTVGLLEEPDGIGAFFEFMVTVGSLGVLCLAREVAICADARTTTTDDGGRYAFTMSGEESQTLFGNPGTFVVAAELPAGEDQVAGPSVQTRFEIDQVEVRVPELSFWEPDGLVVEAGPRWLRYAGAEFPGRPEYTVVVTDRDDVVWSQPGASTGEVDARAVADLAGALHVTALERRRADGVRFATSYHSPHVGFRGVAGPPMSRGASCTVAAPDATPLTPCPFTDARYADDFPHQSCPDESPAGSPEPTPSARCAVDTWVSVDLGARRLVGTLFVHDLHVASDVVAVETSDDGVDWSHQVTAELAAFDVVELPDGTAARYVRLRAEDDPPRFTRLTELSAWP